MQKNNKYEWDLDHLLNNKSFDCLFNTWVNKHQSILLFYIQ